MRRTRGRNGGFSTVGRQYFAGYGTVTPDASATIVDSPTYSQLGLPLDRPLKVLRLKVTLTTNYKSDPRRVRFQIGNTQEFNGIASSVSKVLVPMSKTSFTLRAPRGADFVLNKAANSGVGLLTLFSNGETEKVSVNYEAWVAVGPPATD